MKTEKLNYYLPPDLIAQRPCSIRSDSRLLVLNRAGGDIFDSRFSNIGDFLSPGDCLVLNDTKVSLARYFIYNLYLQTLIQSQRLFCVLCWCCDDLYNHHCGYFCVVDNLLITQNLLLKPLLGNTEKYWIKYVGFFAAASPTCPKPGHFPVTYF